MTCHHLEDALVEHARGMALGPGSAAALESHVEHCAGCAARFAREQELTAGLRALAEGAAREIGSDRLEERLMAAFAAEHLTAQPAIASPSGAGQRWLAVAATIAVLAGAGALATVVLTRDGAGRTTRAPLTPPAPPVTGPAAPTPVAAPVNDAAGAAIQPPRSSRPAPDRPRPGASGGSAMDDFIALPSAFGLPPLESGSIVRVGVPVGSLPAYGVDLIPDAGATEVQADVLVGQDGQPRAIRLVSSTQSSRSPE